MHDREPRGTGPRRGGASLAGLEITGSSMGYFGKPSVITVARKIMGRTMLDGVASSALVSLPASVIHGLAFGSLSPPSGRKAHRAALPPQPSLAWHLGPAAPPHRALDGRAGPQGGCWMLVDPVVALPSPTSARMTDAWKSSCGPTRVVVPPCETDPPPMPNLSVPPAGCLPSALRGPVQMGHSRPEPLAGAGLGAWESADFPWAWLAPA